jgi:hypothetical protein
MYKFVKVKNKRAPILEYNNWYLLCDNIETLISHNEIIVDGEINDGIHEYLTKDNDYKTNFIKNIDKISKELGYSFLNNSSKLTGDLISNKVKLILLGYTLLLTSSLSYMLLDGFEIIDTIEKDILDFNLSKFTEDDIKITQWKFGDHYYAKIGKYDVVIDNEQKWNTFEEAYNKALQYLKTL